MSPRPRLLFLGIFLLAATGVICPRNGVDKDSTQQSNPYSGHTPLRVKGGGNPQVYPVNQSPYSQDTYLTGKGGGKNPVYTTGSGSGTQDYTPLRVKKQPDVYPINQMPKTGFTEDQRVQRPPMNYILNPDKLDGLDKYRKQVADRIKEAVDERQEEMTAKVNVPVTRSGKAFKDRLTEFVYIYDFLMEDPAGQAQNEKKFLENNQDLFSFFLATQHGNLISPYLIFMKAAVVYLNGKTEGAFVDKLQNLHNSLADLADSYYDLDEKEVYYLYDKVKLEAFMSALDRLADDLRPCKPKSAEPKCGLRAPFNDLRVAANSIKIDKHAFDSISAKIDPRKGKFLYELAGQFNKMPSISHFKFVDSFKTYIHLLKTVIDISLYAGEHAYLIPVLTIHAKLQAAVPNCQFAFLTSKKMSIPSYNCKGDSLTQFVKELRTFDTILGASCPTDTGMNKYICNRIASKISQILADFESNVISINGKDTLKIDSSKSNDVMEYIKDPINYDDRKVTPKIVKVNITAIKGVRIAIKDTYTSDLSYIDINFGSSSLYSIIRNLYRYFYFYFLHLSYEGDIIRWFWDFETKLEAAGKALKKKGREVIYTKKTLEELSAHIKIFFTKFTVILPTEKYGTDIIDLVEQIDRAVDNLIKSGYKEPVMTKDSTPPDPLVEPINDTAKKDEELDAKNTNKNRRKRQQEEEDLDRRRIDFETDLPFGSPTQTDIENYLKGIENDPLYKNYYVAQPDIEVEVRNKHTPDKKKVDPKPKSPVITTEISPDDILAALKDVHKPGVIPKDKKGVDPKQNLDEEVIDMATIGDPTIKKFTQENIRPKKLEPKPFAIDDNLRKELEDIIKKQKESPIVPEKDTGHQATVISGNKGDDGKHRDGVYEFDELDTNFDPKNYLFDRKNVDFSAIRPQIEKNLKDLIGGGDVEEGEVDPKTGVKKQKDRKPIRIFKPVVQPKQKDQPTPPKKEEDLLEEGQVLGEEQQEDEEVQGPGIKPGQKKQKGNNVVKVFKPVTKPKNKDQPGQTGTGELPNLTDTIEQEKETGIIGQGQIRKDLPGVIGDEKQNPPVQIGDKTRDPAFVNPFDLPSNVGDKQKEFDITAPAVLKPEIHNGLEIKTGPREISLDDWKDILKGDFKKKPIKFDPADKGNKQVTKFIIRPPKKIETPGQKNPLPKNDENPVKNPPTDEKTGPAQFRPENDQEIPGEIKTQPETIPKQLEPIPGEDSDFHSDPKLIADLNELDGDLKTGVNGFNGQGKRINTLPKNRDEHPFSNLDEDLKVNVQKEIRDIFHPPSRPGKRVNIVPIVRPPKMQEEKTPGEKLTPTEEETGDLGLSVKPDLRDVLNIFPTSDKSTPQNQHDPQIVKVPVEKQPIPGKTDIEGENLGDVSKQTPEKKDLPIGTQNDEIDGENWDEVSPNHSQKPRPLGPPQKSNRGKITKYIPTRPVRRDDKTKPIGVQTEPTIDQTGPLDIIGHPEEQGKNQPDITQPEKKISPSQVIPELKEDVDTQTDLTQDLNGPKTKTIGTQTPTEDVQPEHMPENPTEEEEKDTTLNQSATSPTLKPTGRKDRGGNVTKITKFVPVKPKKPDVSKKTDSQTPQEEKTPKISGIDSVNEVDQPINGSVTPIGGIKKPDVKPDRIPIDQTREQTLPADFQPEKKQPDVTYDPEKLGDLVNEDKTGGNLKPISGVLTDVDPNTKKPGQKLPKERDPSLDSENPQDENTPGDVDEQDPNNRDPSKNPNKGGKGGFKPKIGKGRDDQLGEEETPADEYDPITGLPIVPIIKPGEENITPPEDKKTPQRKPTSDEEDLGTGFKPKKQDIPKTIPGSEEENLEARFKPKVKRTKIKHLIMVEYVDCSNCLQDLFFKKAVEAYQKRIAQLKEL